MKKTRSALGVAVAVTLIGVSACTSAAKKATPPASSSVPTTSSASSQSAIASSSSASSASAQPSSASASGSPTPAPSTSASPSPTGTTPTPTPSFATFTPTATYSLPAVVAAYAGKDISRLPTTQQVVALTFDAGANADAIPKILATLSAENVPATFFLTGAWVRRYPIQAAQIAQRYPIGSHSDTHPYFTKLSNAQIQVELDNARNSITKATGQDPRPLFRFPFGDRDVRTRNFVNSQGYVSVLWTVDTLGWEGTSGGQSVTSVVYRVTSRLSPGEIVLMHVGSHPTDHSTLDGDALRTVIDDLKAAGYGFVTIPQGLGLAH